MSACETGSRSGLPYNPGASLVLSDDPEAGAGQRLRRINVCTIMADFIAVQ